TDVIEVGTETNKVLSPNPRHRVRALNSGLPDFVKDPEIMSEEQFIGDVQIRLAGHPGKVVVPSRKLAKRRVDDIAADLRRESAGQRLVAQEHIVSATGSADAAAVQRRAHELVQITRVFDVVSH